MKEKPTRLIIWIILTLLPAVLFLRAHESSGASPGIGAIILANGMIQVALSQYGNVDVPNARPEGQGYGFRYIPADAYTDTPGLPAESIGVWWNGEGYVLSYLPEQICEVTSTAGKKVKMTCDIASSIVPVVVHSYPDAPGNVGIVPVSIVRNSSRKATSVMKTIDNRLQISFELTIPRADKYATLKAKFRNITSGERLSNLRYKRIVDWDANSGPSDDRNWAFIPEYALIKTDDISPGKTFSYGTSPLDEVDNRKLYNWDLYAWDDLERMDVGSQYFPDGPFNGDMNAALYFNAQAPLDPGDEVSITLVYAVGDGENAVKSVEDLTASVSRARGCTTACPIMTGAPVDIFDFPVGPTGWNHTSGLDFLERFNYRSEVPGDETFHPGEDWNKTNASDYNEPVYAIGNGVIEGAAYSSTWACPDAPTLGQGGVVIIRHEAPAGSYFVLADGTRTKRIWSRYGHLASISSNPANGGPWTPGNSIERGDEVGQVGCGGKVKAGGGPHLHFEIKKSSYLEGNIFEFVSRGRKSASAPYSEQAVSAYYERPADLVGSFIQRHHDHLYP